MRKATLNYLRPGGPVNRRFVAPGAEMNTGTYDPYDVEIRDARKLSPTLASHGFQLFDHHSAVLDFTNTAEVDALYFTESDALIRRVTGATLTIPFGWMRRTSGTTDDGTQPPASEVHVDLTPDRAARIGERFLIRNGHDPELFGRYLIISLWRCFSAPPQDWPLALCAGYSVHDDEGTPNLMVRVNMLPAHDAALLPFEDENQHPAATVFSFNPNHRWYTYPDMTRDEVVMITFYDSAHSPNWRVPHTAFRDKAVSQVVPRQSIELRSIAYWAH
jgi:hypothetical protein